MVAVSVPSSTTDRSALVRGSERTFEDVFGAVTARADLALPDKLLPFAHLRATDDGLIDVPGVGPLALTDWSRRQLAALLGVSWRKWFREDLVQPAEQAAEINRRLQRLPGGALIRVRRWARGETPLGDGVLRAFLTPRYFPIDDLRVFQTLGRVLEGRVQEFRFVRADATPESSQFAFVRARDMDFGNWSGDRHRAGMLIANSETGSRALTIQAWFWRLVCTNGLVLPNSRVFRLVHRPRKAAEFDGKLAEALALVPARWDGGARALREARLWPLEEPVERLRALLAAAPDVRKHTEAVLAAYQREREANRFGLLQAVTRAAQTLAPEERLRLEEFGGRLLADESDGRP